MMGERTLKVKNGPNATGVKSGSSAAKKPLRTVAAYAMALMLSLSLSLWGLPVGLAPVAPAEPAYAAQLKSGTIQSSSTQPIKNGWYKLKSATGGRCLDVSNASTADNANVQIYDDNGTNAQKWYFTHKGNGYYQITNAASGKVLDQQYVSSYDGLNVVQYTALSSLSTQLWKVVRVNGGIVLVNKYSNRALDVSGGYNQNGRNVQVYTRNNTNAQRWTLVSTSKISASSRTVDVGIKVSEVTNYNGVKTVSIPSGTYVIRNAMGRVLDVDGSSYWSGGNIQIYSFNNTSAQKWRITHVGNGYYTLTNVNSGLVADVANGTNANGTNVRQWISNGTAAQHWKAMLNGNRVVFVNEGTGRALDVKDGTNRDRQNVQIWTRNNTNAQRWALMDANTNLYTASVSSIPKQTYTGKAITPNPTVVVGGRTLVRNTDYTLSYSSNVKVGTATVTINAKGRYRGSKKVTFKIVEANLELANLTFRFSNSSRKSDLDYPSYYRIPISSYELIFSSTQARTLYWQEGYWGGSCFGMSATSKLLNNASSGLTVKGFNSSASRAFNLSPTNYAYVKYGYRTLKTCIEAMQVSQYDSKIQSVRNKNTASNSDIQRGNGKLAAICNAVNQSRKTGKVVTVCMWGLCDGESSGHAVVGYKTAKISGTNNLKLYVYDPNFPNKTRYITIYRNSSNKCTGWYYKMNDCYDWGSRGSKGKYCSITYVPYSEIERVWKQGGNANASARTNMLISNSQNFNVVNDKGELVAKVKNGELVRSTDEVWQFVSLDGEAGGAEGGEENVLLYVPADGSYTIMNLDAAVDELDVSMVNVDQSASVTTEGSEVTLQVNDAEEVNLVDVEADKGESYSVELNSELGSAKGQESIELTGVGDDDEATTVGTVSGDRVCENADDATLVVNGQDVDVNE